MSDWNEQPRRLWQSINTRQKYTIGAIALLLFITIIGGSYWWGGRSEYVPLFTNMEAKDAGEVAEKLKESKVPYEIGNDGTAIMTRPEDVYRVRLELASIGLPRGNKGFEIFDQNQFGATEFQNKVYYLQALQGELSRTIEQLVEVEKARVHIVLPADSLYKKEEKPATASIMLTLLPKTELSPEQVRGVVNLVAHSIPDLKAENITVIDNFARVLNAVDEDDQLTQTMGKTNLTFIELTKSVQDRLQKSAQSMLEQVLGSGKAAVRVNVELNFDQRVIDKQIFQPVVDDKGVLRSTHEINEAYQGNTAPLPGGVPGVTSNVPGYVVETDNNSNQTNYDKREFTRNYEINEIKEKLIAAPGSIKRLTVSVLVDANVSRAQQDSISNVVASAVGLNPARGDVIAVEAIPFNVETPVVPSTTANVAQDSTQSSYVLLGLFLVLVLFLFYLLQRRSRQRRERERELQMVASLQEAAAAEGLEDDEIGEFDDDTSDYADDELLAVVEDELTPEERERRQHREVIENLAKTKPDEFAQLVRIWLSDEDEQGR